jgi:hypothetical protein
LPHFLSTFIFLIMTPQEIEIIKQEGYAEAQRYMANATANLQNAGKEDKYYSDRKYVRTACGIAYNGLLIALDAWLRIKGVPEVDRKTIDWYRRNIGQLDRKLLT